MIEITKELLKQLKNVIEQCKNNDYQQALPYLSNASLGQHVRHILDFYVCLLRSKTELVLCYDNRNRDIDVENNKQAAIDLIDGILLDLDGLDLQKTIQLQQSFAKDTFVLESNILRELSYNLEHSIHHMAIIKIALNQSFDYVEVNPFFGIAHSTVSHRNSFS